MVVNAPMMEEFATNARVIYICTLSAEFSVSNDGLNFKRESGVDVLVSPGEGMEDSVGSGRLWLRGPGVVFVAVRAYSSLFR